MGIPGASDMDLVISTLGFLIDDVRICEDGMTTNRGNFRPCRTDVQAQKLQSIFARLRLEKLERLSVLIGWGSVCSPASIYSPAELEEATQQEAGEGEQQLMVGAD